MNPPVENDKNYLEVLMSAFSLVVCVLTLFYLIPNFVEVHSQGWPTPRTFPYITCTLHTFLCTIWLVNSMFGWGINAVDIEVVKQGITLNCILIGLSFFVAVAGYIAGGVVGVTTVIVLVNGIHAWKPALIGGVGITACFYFFFSYVMKLELPQGMIAGF